MHAGGTNLVWLIDPVVGTKANDVTDGKIYAGVPMDDDKNVEYELADSKQEGEIGCTFGPIEELRQSMEFEQSIQADNYGTRNSIW